jgi:hypothetical protein
MTDAGGGTDAAGLGALPLHPGLCADCRHLRLVRSPRSIFVRCALAAVDPLFPRYPRLPVVACAGHQPLGAGPAGGAAVD